MSFRRKTYPEVAESLLNRLIGGVSAEQHPYPPPRAAREPFRHPLERAPVARITAVWGARNGETHRFERDADYRLSADGAQLEWLEAGARPDAGTAFEVHYLPRQRDGHVNDLHPGSVVRTLLEAVALETAGLYAQMEIVYRSGFIDTASGGALDHVVGLLGIERLRAGRNSTELRFVRAKNARGQITILAGTRAATPDGAIEYETLADLMLADGQPAAKVPARDTVASNDGLPADSLTLLVRPIAGIESVTNPAASSRLDRDESDDELRTRAKRFLVGSERGTLGAIEAAVAAEGVRAELDEPTPGVVTVHLLGGTLDPDHRARVRKAIDRVRPAGIDVRLLDGAAPASVELDLRVQSAEGLLDTQLRAAQEAIRKRFADYFAALPMRSDGSLTRLVGLAMGVEGIEDARITAARVGTTDVLDPTAGVLRLAAEPTELGTLRIVDPALATTLTLVVRYPRAAAIPDEGKLGTAVEAAIATLNALAARTDAPTVAKRTAAWGRLTRTLPLPHAGWVAATLEQQFAGAPAAAEADVADYSIQWVFTRPSGVSHVLEASAAPPLQLATEERLSLARVAVDVKPKTS